ncbi:transglutaminase domain-containing protein [Flavobacterium sp. GCM10027622]|uniref:transglutaminase domain-containing protein n=1 Tax=unclassified Flavobacterium TaxID=196869 RepID=UPI003618935F
MKKNTLFLLLFAIVTSFCWAQDYKKVDALVLNYPKHFSSTQKLAQRINADFTNDYEKVRAVYTWIANNVVYDFAESKGYQFEYKSKAEMELLLQKSEVALASRVLSKKKAVCQGYSALFKVICDELKITSRVVSGDGKTSINDIGEKFYPDHAWNIVTVENKEYLIDVTWGAGTYSNRFEKNLNFIYFFSDPYLFIKKHYPERYADTLLQEKIGQQEFSNGPVYYNFDFKLLEPTNGILKKASNQKIKFRFATPKKVENVAYLSGGKYYDVLATSTDTTLEFEIALSQLKKEKELILFFDYESVVGFKLE